MSRDSFGERQRVQYFSYPGLTQPCLLAIIAILNSGILPERATIITRVYNRTSHPRQEDHLFLFWDWQYIPIVIIPSGFASGYLGEGPSGFALAICLIREKGIPVDTAFVNDSVFDAIDKGEIIYKDDQVFKDIKSQSELCRWPWYDWVPEDMEELLERGQLWRHRYLLSYEIDPITLAIGDIDSFNPTVGKKLRLAKEKIEKGSETEDLQSAMIYIRDAWIEITQKLCQVKNIDTTDIERDAVIDRLKKLKLNKVDERLFNLARASFNLYSKHHKRDIDQDTALACVISSIVSMKTVIREVT